MAYHRQRVLIAHNDDGTPVYKWVQGKSIDELNDSIIKACIESGRIWTFLDKPTAKQSDGEAKKPKLTNFHKYVENWLTTYKVQKLKPTTLSGYRSMLRTHLYPAFGKHGIEEITTEDVQIFLNERQHLARKSLNTMLVFLREILSDVVEDGIIKTNPAVSRRIVIPSQKKTVREALTLAQVKDIIQNIGSLGEDDRRFMALLLFTGMRRGEVLGLHWEDIDTEAGLINVVRNVTYTNNQAYIGTPKTKKGTRSIPLDAQLRAALLPMHESGFIFGGEKPLSLTQYRNLWTRIKKAIDLHGATAHVFRHSYLTLAAGTGLDVKTLQTIAGHADIQTTMDRCVHSQPEKIMEAGKRIESLLAL